MPRGELPATFDVLLDELLTPEPPGESESADHGRAARTPTLSGPRELLHPHAHTAIARAAHIAAQTGTGELADTHLLWALARTPETAWLLTDFGIAVDELAQRLHPTPAEPARPTSPRRHRTPNLTAAARHALLAAYRQAHREHAETLTARHLLQGLATDEDSPAGQTLARAIERGHPDTHTAVPTPHLDEFGTDLTALARHGHLDPVIGRDEQIEQALEVLTRRGKNSPVFVGEPGVGKTALVEGLARRITEHAAPAPLAGKRLIALDISALVAGTTQRGQFEQRLRGLLDDIDRHREGLLVFIDEIHLLAGAGGGDGALDAATLLKPALARGRLPLLGATTPADYRRHIEHDPALERRFTPIPVPEPTPEQAVLVLRGLAADHRHHHDVDIDETALRAAVELTDRHIGEKFLPDKAIDVLDQACARLRLDQPQAGTPTVRDRHVADVVARRTGLPVAEITATERSRLLGLEQRLAGQVVGQTAAVRAVAEAVRRARAGLADPHRPIGSFLFLGPTGVGKTELARALAEALFGAPDRMLRLDMGEYQEQHSIARLIGAPPGYLGHDEPGHLTERVRSTPHAVLLLDEIEKAHPEVFNTLLQVLDAGRLTDGRGRTVDFTHTVIVMTSNIGAETLLAHPHLPPSELTETLHTCFRPEFLNRIDETIPFRPLTAEHLTEITALLLQRTERQLHDRGIGMDLTEHAVAWLARTGHDPRYGARPLRRVIQRELDTPLSRLILAGTLTAGTRVHVDATDQALTLRVDTAAGPAPGRHAAHPTG